MFPVQSKLPLGIVALLAVNAICAGLAAQENVGTSNKANVARSRATTGLPAQKSQKTATIHWQRVPLRDALARLHALFDDAVFVDRRIDPTTRISLDIEAASAEEVVAAIAAGQQWGAARLGRVVYLGPSSAADQLRAISAARSQDVARLPAELRASLTKKHPTNWPRLGEPRRVISSVIEHRGWRLANADTIPHDLWSAGELPEQSLAEQLTVLLIGFDLTFELLPNDRSIEIVPLERTISPPSANPIGKRLVAPANSPPPKKGARQVYTLRVQEQPVGAVLKELAKRLHWAIQIDEESIRAAGKSLDRRVSFSVENADQEHLLEAVLRPAGLDYRLEDARVRIIAGRYEKE